MKFTIKLKGVRCSIAVGGFVRACVRTSIYIILQVCLCMHLQKTENKVFFEELKKEGTSFCIFFSRSQCQCARGVGVHLLFIINMKLC